MNLIFSTLLLISLFLAINVHSSTLQSKPTYTHDLLQLQGENNSSILGNVQKESQEISSEIQVGNEGNKIQHNKKKSGGVGRGSGGRGGGVGGRGIGGVDAGIANHHPTNKKKNGTSTKLMPLKYGLILSFAYYACMLFGLLL
ncbi:hypothetical protein RND81_06G193800 [Saponaria officinalis]|uniref:Glycine-rich protein n=1 Tax=Saponaria officinalis TaxID=3572 RepID=A0AAW1KBQ8_SAPOF